MYVFGQLNPLKSAELYLPPPVKIFSTPSSLASVSGDWAISSSKDGAKTIVSILEVSSTSHIVTILIGRPVGGQIMQHSDAAKSGTTKLATRPKACLHISIIYLYGLKDDVHTWKEGKVLKMVFALKLA
jgi:hypothetical protein